MLSRSFHRSPLLRRLGFVSACCVTLAVLGTAIVQAAEFKPFLTVQVAGPNTLISIAEKAISVIGMPEFAAEATAGMAPYKNMRGVNQAGAIGLAIQANAESPFGVDAIVALPISDLTTFNIPGMEAEIAPMRMMLMAMRQGNRYTIPLAMFGLDASIVAYQKQGVLVIATDGAAAFTAAADPKDVFAEVGEFTLGFHVNLEEITEETVEMLLGMFSMALAMQGMEFDPEEIVGTFSEGIGPGAELLREMATITYGLTLDPQTLNLSGVIQTVAKPGTALAEKFVKSKGAMAKTKMGAFLLDAPQTVLSYHYFNYFSDMEIKMIRETWELISEGLMEGLYEAIEDGDGDEEQLEKLVQAMDAFLEYSKGILNFLAREKLLDSAFWLNSEGTFIAAMATDKTAEITALDAKFYGTLLEILGGETIIKDKINQNYETVAGYSLSSISNILADLPFDLPEEVQEVFANISLSLFWAVKDGEAVVYAAGLDFDKAEQTLKAALARTQTPTPPKQTAVFAAKPFAEFILDTWLPLAPKEHEAGLEQAKAMFTEIAKVSINAKYVLVEEYSDISFSQKAQITGELITAFLEMLLKPAVTAAQGAAARMQCANNIRMIALAMHNYHDARNGLPPLYSVDANGRPLHSWRVHILPFIEQSALWESIRLDEPWDSPHNRQFHAMMPAIYGCPDNPGAGCTYSVIAGSATVPPAPGGSFVAATAATPGGRMPRGGNFGEITDGTSNTIAIVEVKEPFNWMNPTADITLDEFAKGINQDGRVGSFHTGGINVGFFDGSVRFVTDTVAPAILRILGNPRSGQSVALP